MRIFPLALTLVLWGCAGPALPAPPLPQKQQSPSRVDLKAVLPQPLNELLNPGFEEDWFHQAFAQNRRFLLLQSSDVGVAAPDGLPDHWALTGSAAWQSEVTHTGQRSLYFRGPGRASQRWRWVGENGWEVGGARYGGFLPMEAALAKRVQLRPLLVGAWCRGQGVARLGVEITAQQRPKADSETGGPSAVLSRQVDFASTSHDWQYRQIEIKPQDLPGTPYFATVSVEAGAGEVWLDDVHLQEKLGADEVNLVPNGDFEVTSQGRASGWTSPQLWKWWRNQYYVWTGWSHQDSKSWRGGAHLDPLIHYDGLASLRFDVFPGDNFAVASQSISLDQKVALPLEARAYVKADQVRSLEIMAQDDRGQWLPQGDFLGDDMENTASSYNMGTTGSGSYDWVCLHKYFSPRRPVRNLKLFLCARGFDGQRVARNLVGTVWWDNVQLYQHGGSAPPPPRQLEGSPSQGLGGRNELDLGQRLWGENLLQLRLVSPATIKLQVKGPDGAVQTRSAPSTQPVAYRVERMCAGPSQQFRMHVEVGSHAADYAFGTPSSALELLSDSVYAYPDERIRVFQRVNVSDAELKKLDRLDLLDERSGKPVHSQKGSLALELRKPQAVANFYEGQRSLVWAMGAQGQTVHPWSEPTRDLNLTARLYDLQGKEVAHSAGLALGFMHKIPPPSFPPRLQSSGVDERNHLLLNGKPYLPVYWTPNFDRPHEGNYPPRLWGYSSLDLNGQSASSLAALVPKALSNPKFFAYELGEGEMQLQGAGWPLRLRSLAGVAERVRALDPGHLINGPESWLIGHPGHNQALASFTPIFDVVGVETSFDEVPEADRYRGDGRPCAVLAGLEAYYYQPLESLRWRGYRALYEGCGGVGLCPSEMLKASPAHLNYLRGLNGEFRGLEAVLLAPPSKTVSAQGSVQVFERVWGGKHYLFCMSAPGAKGFPLTATFQGVRGPVKVRGEGRSLKAEGSLRDVFSGPYSVHLYEY